MNFYTTEMKNNNNMSKLFRVIKLFDIYGSYFNLRINNQAKFKSIMGGLFSLITMGVFMFCILSFGQDFYYKRNPKISVKESFLPDEEAYILTGDDYQDKNIMLSFNRAYDRIFIPLLFNIYESNFTQIILNQCVESDLTPNQAELLNRDGYKEYNVFYCFKVNDFIMGTDSLAQREISPSLSISIRKCDDIPELILKKYDITCNLDYLQDKNNSIDSLYVDLVFERYGFVPENFNPFQKRLSSLTISFEKGKFSKVDIPLMMNTLEDDRGIISSSVNTETVLNIMDYKKNDFHIGESNFPSASIYFYVSEGYKTYFRSYQKLQDLLAAIGGFMKIIFASLNILNFIIRSYLIDMHIIETLFRREESETDFNKALKGNLSIDTIKSSKIILYIIYLYFTLCLENKFNNYFLDENLKVKESKLKITSLEESKLK